MLSNRLRVYYGPDDQAALNSPPAVDESQVRVALSDILPLLADAYRSQRTWLEDFSHDEVTISTDLYECILAYQHCRRPVA